MEPIDPSSPDALPRAYALWRRRTLAGALVATAVGLVVHGPVGELRIDLEGGWPSPWTLIGLLALLVGAFGPGLAGTVFALAAIRSWRRLGASSRSTRAAWLLWVLGPLPILLVPLAHLFHLDAPDSLKTSAMQVRYLLTVTVPALFALLPGVLRSALVLERFVPESRAPGQIILLVAPVCTVACLIPLAILTQLAFHGGLYLGLMLLASSSLVPLLAVGRLLRRDSPDQAARLVRSVVMGQRVLSLSGVAILATWLGEHDLLRPLIGRIDAVWVLGLAAKVLAGKWLTEVVVTDVLLSMLHQGREAQRAMALTQEGATLARKLDALGQALRPNEPKA